MEIHTLNTTTNQETIQPSRAKFEKLGFWFVISY